MIDALMTGELERYATADLNRTLLDSEIQTLEKVKHTVQVFLQNFTTLCFQLNENIYVIRTNYYV